MNFVKPRKVLLIVVVIVSFCLSCKTSNVKDIDHGEIHFNIEYKGERSGFHREIMPKNLVVMFKDDNILFDITSNIGNAGIVFLSNHKKGYYDMYCSMLTLKYYYSGNKGEQMPGFEAMNGMELHKTAKTMDICGYECHCVEATFPIDRDLKYEIWYTNEIDVKNPNEATPFGEIDGVVMKFFFLIGGLEMHFTAENVYKKEIDDRFFERRTNYVAVTSESLDQFIYKMINF